MPPEDTSRSTSGSGTSVAECVPESAGLVTIPAMPGDLYYGDSLDIMRRHLPNESVDLIYLDPPFNSDETYGLLHRDSQAQQEAFWDSWHWDDAARDAYAALAEGGHGVPRELSDMIVALKAYLYPKHKDMLAYLSMMGIRLVEMRRVLRRTGSLYLHCDPTASHYLKLILDMIFGPENFRSEVVWKRTGAHNSARRYGPIHDTILYYARDAEHVTWNAQRSDYSEDYVDTKYRHVDAASGRRYRLSDLTGSGIRHGESGRPWRGHNPTHTKNGRHWAVPRHAIRVLRSKGVEIPGTVQEQLELLYTQGLIRFPQKADGSLGVPEYKRFRDDMRGIQLQDVWTDIDPLNSMAKERIGYGTQKPVELVKRVLAASSNAGDLILDPFCGCGTTIEAAEGLGLKWIGIDIAIRAVDVMKERLDAKFGRIWTEHGEPKDIEQAERLSKNEYDFQWWAVRMLGGQPPKGEKKKGADDGVDGELRLIDDSGTLRRGLISVKAGTHLNPDFIKTLNDNVREKKYDFGIFASMHEPTQGMRDKAADYGAAPWAAGYKGKVAHKIRIVTAPEWMPPSEIQWPGKLDRPRSRSAPPPPEARRGETIPLPFAAGRSIKKAKPRMPGQAKTAYPTREQETLARVADSVPPPKK